MTSGEEGRGNEDVPGNSLICSRDIEEPEKEEEVEQRRCQSEGSDRGRDNVSDEAPSPVWERNGVFSTPPWLTNPLYVDPLYSETRKIVRRSKLEAIPLSRLAASAAEESKLNSSSAAPIVSLEIKSPSNHLAEAVVTNADEANMY
ncbi:hypothetical protein M758_UG237700 [Ceratodon purpureus]|nr:hypothetical protein M758_UG237700 [Ceratodon purpureus]